MIDKLYLIREWAKSGSDPTASDALTIEQIDMLESLGLAKLETQTTEMTFQGNRIEDHKTLLVFTARGNYEADRQLAMKHKGFRYGGMGHDD